VIHGSPEEAVCVRSYHPDHPATLGLSSAAIVDRAVALVAEPGQPVAWMHLDHRWASCFADDLTGPRLVVRLTTSRGPGHDDIIAKARRGRETLNQIKTLTDH
jgi:hypothetical protein